MDSAQDSNGKNSNSPFGVIPLIEIGFAFILLVSLISCYDSSSESTPPPIAPTQIIQNSQTSTGQSLYEANCAGCHGADGSSINGNTPDAINAAITNIGIMSGVSLTTAELQAISDYLTGNSVGDTGSSGETSDGQALYEANCASCHGADGSALAARTGAQIAAAIVNVSTMSGISLSGNEIQAIADFLGGGYGQALYAANCAGCHGADGTTLSGRTGAQIAAAIVDVSTMSGVSLSGTEIQAIADFLGGGSGGGGTSGPPASHTNSEDGVMHAPGNTLPFSNGCTVCHGATLEGGVGPSCFACHGETWNESPPSGGGGTGSGGSTDGQALYTTYCAACHGATGTSLTGRTVDQISIAISNVTTMSSIALSLTEVQAIADYLASNSGGGTGGGDTGGDTSSLPANHTNSEEGVLHADGNDNPYTNGCTTCHGSTLQGEIGPSCFACHGVEWSESPPSGGGDTGGGGTVDGQALYTANCAACHGATGSNINGRTASAISTAIANIGSMSNVSLTSAEIQAVSDYLTGSTGGGDTGGGTGGGGTVDGQALYTANCAACHGATGSNINGRTASAISAAIANIGSMSNVLLTSAEIQAVSDYLTGSTGGGTGGGDTGGDTSSLPANHTNSEEGVLHADGNDNPYTNGCTTCHGSTLQGEIGPSCFACHGVEWSESPPSGSGDTSTGGTVDGQALYAANCAACHGATGSNINGRTASAISVAIANIGSMSNVSLTSAEIQAVSDYLTGSTGGGDTGGGTGGGDTSGPPASHTNAEDGILHAPGNNYPYSNSCTTCHGSTLQGGIGPSCFACHGVEWSESTPSGGGDTGGGGTGGTTDGQALYTANCSACHGASGSNINGRTASVISNAIANVGSMNNISLTSAEIQSIADYLAGSTGGGDDGGSSGLPTSHTDSEEGVLHAPGNNYPYVNGCTSCHGSNLQGGIGPSCYSCHGQEWNGSDSDSDVDGGSSDGGDSDGSEEEEEEEH